MQTIREWARSQGYAVGQRGRIPHEAVEAYQNTFGVGAIKIATKPKTNTRKDIDEVRKWALDNGYKVSERGRVSAKVKNAYDKAHKPEVSDYVRELANKLLAEKIKGDSIVVKDRFGRTYRTQFCCGNHHDLCPKVVMNATLVGQIRKNVICDCGCHK